MKKKQLIEIGIVCVLLLLLGAYIEHSEQNLDEKNRIIRGSPGSGEQQVELTLDAEDQLQNYTYKLTVPAEKVTKEMAASYFEKAKKEIDQSFFSEGETPESVTHEVNMGTSYAGGIVEAEWMLDRYDVVEIDGTIREEKLTEDGELVQAKALLTCGAYESEYIFSFHVYPRSLSKPEQIVQQINYAIEEQSTEEGCTYLTLPEQVGNVTLHWKEKKQHLVGKILFFEVLVLFLLIWMKMEQKRTAEKEKKEQMALDYAEIVSKLLILMGAGMSLKQSWNKISAQYLDKRQKKEQKKRYIYEEMLITNHAIMDGESEKCAYQKFSERVDVSAYQRLIRILLQNLQTGSRGLCQLLEQEAESAMEERKALARKLGEEAGTKMLLPLLLMLGIVIAIIMVPALLSFQI